MPYTPDDEAKLALVRGMYNDVLFALDASRVDDYIAQDYIQHSSLAEPGIEGLKAWLRVASVESPDARQTLHHLFVDGDHVIGHTHVVRWPGDRGAAVMDIYRIEDGRIKEHWDVIQEIPENPVNPTPMF
jgi:predicted SnoaL-like aldol condensation-catalyzing enzyme